MNASPSQARSYRAARFPVSLLCVNRHRSLRLLWRLRRRGRTDGGGEGFIRGLNASGGGGCQHRFTRAQNRLITPLTRVQKCNVAPPPSVIGGKEEEGLIFKDRPRYPRSLKGPRSPRPAPHVCPVGSFFPQCISPPVGGGLLLSPPGYNPLTGRS